MGPTEEEIINELIDGADTLNYLGWTLVVFGTLGLLFLFLSIGPLGLLAAAMVILTGVYFVSQGNNKMNKVVARHQQKEREEKQRQRVLEQEFMPPEDSEAESEEQPVEKPDEVPVQLPDDEPSPASSVRGQGSFLRELDTGGRPLEERFPELFPEEEQTAPAAAQEKAESDEVAADRLGRRPDKAPAPLNLPEQTSNTQAAMPGGPGEIGSPVPSLSGPGNLEEPTLAPVKEEFGEQPEPEEEPDDEPSPNPVPAPEEPAEPKEEHKEEKKDEDQELVDVLLKKLLPREED